MIASSKRLFACAALLLVPRVAAGAQPAPTEADLETARSLYREAVALHRQDRLDEALARITAAYRTVRTPVIAVELAKIDVQLGRLDGAYDVLRGIDELAVSARETDKGREARREASVLLASVRSRLGTIKVLAPAEAEAQVDGARVESPEQGRAVMAGAHVVTVHLGARVCATTSVTVQEGEARAIDLRDRAAACAAESAPAVASEPKIAPREIDASDPAPVAIDHPTEAARPSPDVGRWLAYGLVGAGTVATVTGAIVALRARADYDTVAGLCSSDGCNAYAFSVRQAARTHAVQATYAIALGLGAIAGGVTLWIVDPWRDHAKGRRVGLAIAPGSVWMTVVIP